MKEKVFEIIESGEFKNNELKGVLGEMNPVDIADIFSSITDNATILRMFKLLSKDDAAEVFSYLESDEQELLLRSMSDKETAQIVEDMFVDDMVDVLEEMPSSVVKKVLKNADEEMRKILNEFLNYPEDSAGSIMTIEFVSLKKSMTVKDAFVKIKETGLDKETIYTCYVTTEDRKLEGVITVKTLLLESLDKNLGEIMETNVISCQTLDDRESVAASFRKYGFGALPVVDKENRLVGIITIDDIFEVIEEEHTEDIEKMAGLTPSEKPYLETSVFRLSRNRIFWLLFLLVSGFLTGIVMQGFEEALEASNVLFFSIPMLMGTGGNGGAQASTLIIRGLALNEITPRDWLKIVWKELRVALFLGLGLAPICFGKVMLIDGGGWKEALTVSTTMICVLIISKTIGSLLPITATALKKDPAVMAAPLITTIVDVLALLIYFGLALLIVF